MSSNDLKRRVERELNEKGVVFIPKDASEQDVKDILDAGMEVVREQEALEDEALSDIESPSAELHALSFQGPIAAYGCICMRPSYACDCGAALEEERRDG